MKICFLQNSNKSLATYNFMNNGIPVHSQTTTTIIIYQRANWLKSLPSPIELVRKCSNISTNTHKLKKKKCQIPTVNNLNVVIWRKIQHFLNNARSLRALHCNSNSKPETGKISTISSVKTQWVISIRRLRRTEETYRLIIRIFFIF